MTALATRASLVPRLPAFAALTAALTLNAFARSIGQAFGGGVAEDLTVMGGLLGVSAIVWFALFAIVKLALEQHATPASKADFAVLAGCLLAAVLPIAIAAAAMVPVVGAYLFRRSAPGTLDRRFAVIVLALSGPVFFGPVVRVLLGPEWVKAETLLLAALFDLPTQGNVIMTEGGRTYVVAGNCSSLHNISMAILVVASLSQLLDIRGAWKLAACTALASLAVIAVNSVRLLMIAKMPDHFDYLHVGGGRTWFSWAAMLAMTGVTILSLRYVARGKT